MRTRTGQRSTRHGERGFTLAEALASMLFLAIVVPVTIECLLVANRSGVFADRSRTAAQLADRTLTDTIVTGDWRTADSDGDFGEDYPGYRWTLTSETWSEDSIRLVSVEVFFIVQGREYSVRLSTLAEETES